ARTARTLPATSRRFSSNRLSFPNERVENPLRIKVQTTIESHGSRVRFRHCQRQHAEVSLAEIQLGGRQQRLSNSFPAILRQHAYLSHVPHVVPHSRAKDQSDQTSRSAIKGNER